MKQESLREILTAIEEDIIRILTESKTPLTDDQIHDSRAEHFSNTSAYGYTIALDNLERKGKVKSDRNDKYSLHDKA